MFRDKESYTGNQSTKITDVLVEKNQDNLYSKELTRYNEQPG